MYIIFKEAEIPVHIVRWTRVFRPLFLINISEGRQVRNKLKRKATWDAWDKGFVINLYHTVQLITMNVITVHSLI